MRTKTTGRRVGTTLALAALLATALATACGAVDGSATATTPISTAPPSAAPAPPSPSASGPTTSPPTATATARPTASPVATAAPEPPVAPDSPEGAVQVVRAYYAAIDAGDFARAYSLWENGGQASGLSLAEFQQGFAETEQVEARVGPAGRIEGAAGSRYVEVPVDLTATTTDGRVQRFQGSLVLRRSVVPGATPEQQRWHIYRAEIVELPAATTTPGAR